MSKFEPYQPIKELITNDYILLDLPYHINTGDLLIWEGELTFLKHEVNHRMLGYYNMSTFGFSTLNEDTIILLHGGGNFGDVWRHSQEFRLKVLKRYPENRIVIFPQSVYYSKDELAIADAKQFAKHKDLTICARDKVSYEYLTRYFKNTLLCIPDMAFCIDSKTFAKNILKPTKENLYFKRSDHEGRDLKVDFIEGEYATHDWPNSENLPRYMKSLYLSMVVLDKLHRNNILCQFCAKPLAYAINLIFMHIIRPLYIGKGVRFISSYKNIYTTRLHGLILSYLLGKDIYIVPNNNGKLENYYNSWLTDSKNIRIVNC